MAMAAETTLCAPPSTVSFPVRVSAASVVLRAAWEGHWEEDMVLLCDNAIVFIPPLSAEFSLIVPVQDIVNVSAVPTEESFVPGYFSLRIETLGRVHSICFVSLQIRDSFAEQIFYRVSESATRIQSTPSGRYRSHVARSARWVPASERAILNSRRLAFLDSRAARAPFVDGVYYGTICAKGPKNKSSNSESFWKLSNVLLEKAYKLGQPFKERTSSSDSLASESAVNSQLGVESASESPPEAAVGAISGLSSPTESTRGESVTGRTFDNSFELHREEWIDFLDAVSELKFVPLHLLDFSSADTFVFFANVFHTLLLHGKLLFGCVPKAQWADWYGSVSYEIGDDVFSLKEIEYCVIRGGCLAQRLAMGAFTPQHSKGSLAQAQARSQYHNRLCGLSRWSATPPPPSDSHYAYACNLSDPSDASLAPLAHFALNYNTVSTSRSIVAYTPRNLKAQLKAAMVACLLNDFSIDMASSAFITSSFFNIFSSEEVLSIYNDHIRTTGHNEHSTINTRTDKDTIHVLSFVASHIIKYSPQGADCLQTLLNLSADRLISIKYTKFKYESNGSVILVLEK
jgi:hypothetical protein